MVSPLCLAPVAMDSGGARLFDRLPHTMRDSFLQQAFKELDERHKFPLVCRLWQQLLHSSCSSLDVVLRSATAAEGMAAWLERHKPDLESISLRIDNRLIGNSIRQRLLGPNHSKAKLQTLKICDGYRWYPKYPLSTLTNLTSLHLIKVRLAGTTQLGSSILRLTQLRRLNLERVGFAERDAATFRHL